MPGLVLLISVSFQRTTPGKTIPSISMAYESLRVCMALYEYQAISFVIFTFVRLKSFTQPLHYKRK